VSIELGHSYDFYCDESGNSGGDFWNKDQPVYVLAGWLVKKEERFKVDAFMKKSLQKYYPLSKELKAKDIMGSVKGTSFFQHFLHDIGQLCTPFFYLAEKRYLVAAKLVEAFLDPAHNENLYDEFTWLNVEKKNIAQTLYDKCPKTIDDYAELYKRPKINLLEQLRDTLISELESHNEHSLAEVIRGANAHLDDILWEEEYGIVSLPRRASKTINYPIFEALCTMIEHFARQKDIKKVRIIHDEIAQLQRAYTDTFNIHRNAGEMAFQYQDGTYSYTRFERIQTLRFGKSVMDPMIQAADLLAGLIAGLSVRILRGEKIQDDLKELGKAYLIGTLFVPDMHGIKIATSSSSRQFIISLKKGLD
jgi:hypothetical protein